MDCTVTVKRILGGAACGKSDALLEDAARLSQDGDVLVVCASKAAARALGGAVAPGVEALTVHEAALRVLGDTPGGAPHVLDATEEAVLFEDLRPCGVKQRRLRNIFGFLKRGWSDLSCRDADWIRTVEEKTILGLVEGNLAFMGAALEAQLSECALTALEHDDDLRKRHTHRHVLADDYGLMSRSSQKLAEALAGDSLTIAADTHATLAANEPFPNPKGIDAFAREHPGCIDQLLEGCRLPASIGQAIACLDGKADEGTCADDALEVRMASGFADEQRLVMEAVQNALDQGIGPDRIVVVGTNAAWRANTVRMLNENGIGAQLLDADKPADFRSSQRCAKRWEATIARLAADSSNGVAWRTWLAFDDHLGRSAAVARLRERAQGEGFELAAALQRLNDGTLPMMAGADETDERFFDDLAAAYRHGLERIAAFRNGPQPAEEPAHEEVLVCRPVDIADRRAAVVVFGGFVNGFIPSRDYFDNGVLVGQARERAHSHDVQTVRMCLASADRKMTFTGFTECSIEAAERLKLHIKRIRLKNGARMCTIEPSILLEAFIR